MMAKRTLAMAVSLVAALALATAPAWAAGHGGAGPHHGRHPHRAGGRAHVCGTPGHRLCQLEGTVVSFSGTAAPSGTGTLVLHLGDSAAMTATVTVAISTSTIIMADKGVTPTLAAGERVHVAASQNADGSFTAVRVLIQSGAHAASTDADEASAPQEHGNKPRGEEHGQRVRQVEGTVVSVASAGTSVVLQPMNSKTSPVTIGISTSTVITAEEGVPPTLAAGEQVHVTAAVGADGSFTAVRVVIQKPAAEDRDQSRGGKGKHHA